MDAGILFSGICDKLSSNNSIIFSLQRNSMRFVIYLLLITGPLFIFSPESAHAQNWKRARLNLVMTYYESNIGETIDDIPLADRVIVMNQRLDRNSSRNGVKVKCRDNRAVKQRVCTQTWTYETPDRGTCAYAGKYIYNNFTSSRRKLSVYVNISGLCQDGYRAYTQYSGSLTRSL
jgi:hypothetical protein